MTFEQWWEEAVDNPEQDSDEKQLSSAAWERALIEGSRQAYNKLQKRKPITGGEWSMSHPDGE